MTASFFSSFTASYCSFLTVLKSEIVKLNGEAIPTSTKNSTRKKRPPNKDKDYLSFTSSLKVPSTSGYSLAGATYDNQCPVCFLGFASARSLNNHLPLHDKYPRFHCQFCPADFFQKNKLSLHLRKNHNEDFA